MGEGLVCGKVGDGWVCGMVGRDGSMVKWGRGGGGDVAYAIILCTFHG